MPCGSIKGTQTMLPLASPQVVQTRKHSVEVRIAEPRPPYKFPLIFAPARLTAVSVLEGQGGHSSHRGQASCCLPSEHPHKKRPFAEAGQASRPHILLTAGTQKPYNCCLGGTQLLSGVKVSQEFKILLEEGNSMDFIHANLNVIFFQKISLCICIKIYIL